MYFWLIMLSVSYWYCLPVISTSAFGYNEFRGYDLLLLGGAVVMLFKYWRSLSQFFRQDMPGKWLLRFCLWATVMSPVSLAWNLWTHQLSMTGVVLMDLFHLWGFTLAYAAFRVFVRTRRQCLVLLGIFLSVGVIEAVIICFQSIHVLPVFWSDRYAGYGDKAFSGTLGMNRTLPGHAMVLLLSVAFTCLYNFRVVGMRIVTLAGAASMLGLAGLLVAGSRTAWVVAAAFFGMAFLHRRLALPMIAFTGAVAVLFLALAPDSFKERATEMYDYKISAKLATVNSDNLVEQFQAVDSGRLNIWIGGLKTLLQKPFIIPFGLGFINCGSVVKAGSAHNVYITLIVELGIVGLGLYLMWLVSLWRQSGRLMSLASSNSQAMPKRFYPVGMGPLLLALCLSLTGGEILYVYRPCFAFLGMFLFVWAVSTHPALVFGSVNAQVRSPARRTAPTRSPSRRPLPSRSGYRPAWARQFSTPTRSIQPVRHGLFR
jgi:hypothetical protein